MSPRLAFSTPRYLLVVCLLSWPFQFAYVFLGEEYRPILLLSMVMAGVATVLAARFLFGDDLSGAGWAIGNPRYYLLALLLALLLWLLPVLLEPRLGIRSTTADLGPALQLFAVSAVVTLLPAFGEEISWRGYLLPKLCQSYHVRKALLIQGLVTWIWHLPFLLAIAVHGSGDAMATFLVIALVSLIPAVLHAVIFAWFWQASGSLLVATFYHVAFDEVRDSLQTVAGFGWLAENWQMLAITLLGSALLWKARWPGLQRGLRRPGKNRREPGSELSD